MKPTPLITVTARQVWTSAGPVIAKLGRLCNQHLDFDATVTTTIQRDSQLNNILPMADARQRTIIKARRNHT
jgi:hypothetical protein